MIRPAAFGFNPETAENNFFQQASTLPPAELQQKALEEFDAMVASLQANDVEVIIVEDTPEPPKPGAVFPNNWFSTAPNGIVSVFPMYAPSRRTEKRDDILKMLASHFTVTDVQDWTEFEADGRFLEGTGSMVIDHDHKMIYAALSERTNPVVLEKFASAMGYQAIVFWATDGQGRTIYHTNVMLSIGEEFAVLCEESIAEEWELIAVRQLLESTHHRIIPISFDQLHAFAGNLLQIRNKKGEKLIVLSQSAFSSLKEDQRKELSAFGKLLPVDVSIIEKTEGGSVRCMMAEVFLSIKVLNTHLRSASAGEA